MTKTLELQFSTETGKVATVSIDHPKEPIDSAAVKSVMTNIISSNVFQSSKGRFITVKGARLLERNVTDYVIAD
ncbi:DUF2922 domain-containing protein [Rossellomorea aquimaris]|uniref:DUF2922 domain-containing protein n=1 Tax=Rossellomorea aquimaris TaxID=189382 RepID=UPI0007D04A31|nr:DUF2922 domain-containing protein [Rossellomorea aquimaris]